MNRLLFLSGCLLAALLLQTGCESSPRVQVGSDVGPNVGQVAPEIEGVDLDGVPFKLSDYRGQVVMLSFFGDW